MSGTRLLAAIMQRLLPAPSETSFTTTKGDEHAVSDESPLAAFVFKTREDKYGKTSYLRIFGGKLESDSRIADVTLSNDVRVGSLGVLRGKDLDNVSTLHAGDIGAVVKLGDTGTNNTPRRKGVVSHAAANSTAKPDLFLCDSSRRPI